MAVYCTRRNKYNKAKWKWSKVYNVVCLFFLLQAMTSGGVAIMETEKKSWLYGTVVRLLHKTKNKKEKRDKK